jgi:hypothetical protein
VDVSHKLGVAGDHVRVTIDDIVTEAGKGIQLNLRPGLGGLEIVGPSGSSKLPVKVEAVIGGKKMSEKFTVPMDGGARLKLSTVLSKGALGVSRIDKLFGPAKEVRLIDHD